MAISFIEQRNVLKEGAFRERVVQAILTAALAIRHEADTAPNHASRIQLVKAVIANPAMMEQRFSELLATQIPSAEPSDTDISNGLSAIWDTIALTLYPA